MLIEMYLSQNDDSSLGKIVLFFLKKMSLPKFYICSAVVLKRILCWQSFSLVV